MEIQPHGSVARTSNRSFLWQRVARSLSEKSFLDLYLVVETGEFRILRHTPRLSTQAGEGPSPESLVGREPLDSRLSEHLSVRHPPSAR